MENGPGLAGTIYWQHYDELKAYQVFGIELETNKIFQISNVLDPEKLRSISSGLK